MSYHNPNPANPFIKASDRYSRTEYYLDFESFAPALAKALGGTVADVEAGTIGSARLRVADLTLYIRPEFGAKFGRVEIMSGQPEPEKLIHYSDRPSFPSGSFDTGRALDKLAADIQRRIIAAAAAPAATLKARIEKTQSHRAKLEAAARELNAQFPAVQITVKDGTGVTHADVYYNHAGAYLYGRLNADGSLYVDRISGADPVKLFQALGL